MYDGTRHFVRGAAEILWPKTPFPAPKASDKPAMLPRDASGCDRFKIYQRSVPRFEIGANPLTGRTNSPRAKVP